MMRALIVMALLSLEPEAQKPATCTLEGKVSLAPNAKTKPQFRTVVVYVDGPRDASHDEKVHQIRQKNREFLPATMVVHAGDSIEFINDDKFAHDVFSAAKQNTFYSQSSSKSVTEKRPFPVSGPVRINCHLHKMMRADVLVLDNDWYDANLKADGSFTIKDVPARSKLKLTAWEPNGNTVTVEVRGCSGETKVPRIELEQKAPPPELDIVY